MIHITLILCNTENPYREISVGDSFFIKGGFSQKDLFALYQRGRAKLGVTKYGESKKNLGVRDDNKNKAERVLLGKV